MPRKKKKVEPTKFKVIRTVFYKGKVYRKGEVIDFKIENFTESI